MSLPLTRRIAKVALLVAAGAAPLAGATGPAQALNLPESRSLGALDELDTAATEGAVDGVVRGARPTVERAGDQVLDPAVPTVGRTLDGAGRTLAPVSEHTPSQADDQLAGLLSKTADVTEHSGLPDSSHLLATLEQQNLPTDGLDLDTVTGGQTVSDRLPSDNLPLQQLPVENTRIGGLPAGTLLG